MNLEEFNLAPFHILDKEWALLTSGDKDNFNSMTVSWGGLGTLWHKPVVTVYIRPNRYTYEFMHNNEYFTLSFYNSEYQKDLSLLGSISGRNKDKIALTSLTPEILESGITFKEAKLTIVCKKIYYQNLEEKNLTQDIREKFYKEEPIHCMFIGEVISIFDKE